MEGRGGSPSTTRGRQGATLLPSCPVHGGRTQGVRPAALAVVDVDRIRISYAAARFDFSSQHDLLPGFGAPPVDQITTRRIEAWKIRWLAEHDARLASTSRSIRVDGSFSHGEVTTTKGDGRAPSRRRRTGTSARAPGQRGYATGQDDPVFPADIADHLGASALRRRFVAARDAAALRPLRFHDLRHTFRSLAINRASIVQVQAWMGHADAKTTMRYLHHKSQENEPELLADAFRPTDAPGVSWFRRACGSRQA